MFYYSMWMLVHTTHLALSSASPSYGIFCCSFLIKILHNSEMNFKTYPYLPFGVCCIETPTNHLHTTFVKINQYSSPLLLSFPYIKIRNKHTIPHYTVRLQLKTQLFIIFIYTYYQINQNTELIHCPQQDILLVNGKH